MTGGRGLNAYFFQRCHSLLCLHVEQKLNLALPIERSPRTKFVWEDEASPFFDARGLSFSSRLLLLQTYFTCIHDQRDSHQLLSIANFYAVTDVQQFTPTRGVRVWERINQGAAHFRWIRKSTCRR